MQWEATGVLFVRPVSSVLQGCHLRGARGNEFRTALQAQPACITLETGGLETPTGSRRRMRSYHRNSLSTLAVRVLETSLSRNSFN